MRGLNPRICVFFSFCDFVDGPVKPRPVSCLHLFGNYLTGRLLLSTAVPPH
jgi:hypothetical protein